MKRIILQIISIIAAFCLGVAAMGWYLSAANTDSTTTMAEATLPLVYMEQDGRTLNLLHGYTQEMDLSYIRDTVLPLPEDREVTFTVETYGADVDAIYYEVRSLDGERLIEDGEITDYSKEGDELGVTIWLKDLLDDGEEYFLVITLDLGKGGEACYYERVANTGETYIDECLDFVEEFHEALFDKDTEFGISTYLETSSSADNTTLADVTLENRYKQMLWGDMDIEYPVDGVRIYITEIEESITGLRLEYISEYENEDGETESYEIVESYRVRYTESRMYMLSYERQVDRIFDPDLSIFSDEEIELGILNTEVEYKKNEEENVVAFVQNGELWCYDVAQNKLSHVYGFRDGDDLRASFDEHAIRILNVYESGSVDFMVYGYMNRGTHEGETGIAVFSYDSLTNSVEERVFIESDKPFSAIEAGLGELAYVSTDLQFYLYLDGSILKTDLESLEMETLAGGVALDGCMLSDDGEWAAWQLASTIYDSTALMVMNLETGESIEIDAQDGCYIRALGFMGTDFIYGEAAQEDVCEDASGDIIFPMGSITIIDEDGEVVREFDYGDEGKYVVSITLETNRIVFNCVQKNEDGDYEEADDEPITNKSVESDEKISLDTKTSDDKQTEYIFTLTEGDTSGSLKQLSPKLVVSSTDRNLTLDDGDEDELYYAYSFDNTIVGAYADVSDAVRAAYDVMGVVVDADQNYIWKRGGRKTYVTLSSLENPQQQDEETSLQAALEILLGGQNTYSDVEYYLDAGYSAYEILSAELSGEVLDLSGCTLNMVLYYVSQGYPVLAVTGETQAELITGYDTLNIVVTDPLELTSSRRGMNDSTTLYEEADNLFIVCIPEE